MAANAPGFWASPHSHVPHSHVDAANFEYVTGNGRYVGQRPGTRVDSGSCGPQATWERALQGAPHVNTLRETDGTVFC
eukprot:5317347-Prymnesium_polylepis.1